MAHSSGRHWQC